ncbi:MAG TPA: OmpA family protein [Spirochaetota bacterium]|nr:OmpA family protein [Spirochaetota bacterium]
MKHGIITIISLFAIAGYIAADPLPGAAWHTTGFGASALASGGAVVQGRGTPADTIANPAALAASEQTLLELTGGAFGTDDIISGLGLSLPTSRGILTFNGLWSTTEDSTNYLAGTAIGLRTSFSKLITPHFHFGFGLSLIHVLRSPDDAARIGIAADLGFIILQNGTPGEKKESALETGFGIFDIAFGLSFNNLGLNPSWDGWEQHPDARTVSGISFSFFKSEFLRVDTLHDVTLSFDGFRMRYSGGLGIGLFDAIWLRSGLMLGNRGMGNVTLGASVDLRHLFGDTGFDLSWAWVPLDWNGRDQYSHILSLSMVLGGLDREGPAVEVKSRLTHFSPNNDGIQDSTVLDISIADNRELKGWRITISDESNRVIRSLVSHGEADTELTLGKFFELLFATRNSVPVPSTWEWNGTDETGKLVPDGTYTCRAEAWDARLNKSESKPGTITINTRPPVADLKISLTLFSPNGDGNKDVTIIEQTTGGRDTRWTGYITDQSGKKIRTFEWGETPPKNFPWDGKDGAGRIVPDGNYEYILEGNDRAGNRVTRKLTDITVSTRTRPIEVRVSADTFSPNGDGRFDAVAFTPRIDEQTILESWELAIATTNGKTVRSFGGGKTVPEKIGWDGRDNQGNILPDGHYVYTLKANYPDGDSPRTFPRKIAVDTTGPVVRLTTAPALFSPDDDGENDQLRIVLSLDDPSGISDWQVVIRQNDRIFKTFSGKSPRVPTFTILWDGKADNGESVESATSYTIQANAMDTVGNAGTPANGTIEVDILVIKTSRGLKILITNIEFAYDKWDLAKPESPILNRVADVLKRYGEYKIIIEGHTDGTGDVEYNLMLSTRRARTVLRYLLKRGVEDSRMLAKGLGMSMPVANNTTEEGRAKNRRVEFILVKDE